MFEVNCICLDIECVLGASLMFSPGSTAETLLTWLLADKPLGRNNGLLWLLLVLLATQQFLAHTQFLSPSYRREINPPTSVYFEIDPMNSTQVVKQFPITEAGSDQPIFLAALERLL